MAVTGTSVMADSVATAYDKDYMAAFAKMQVFFDLAEWGEPIGGDGMRGSTIQQAVIEEMDPATSALGETSDVTPVALADSNVQITIGEYGNAVQLTKFLSTVSYTNTEKMAAEAVGQNQARSLDLVARVALTGGTLVFYPTHTSRVTLTTADDKPTYDFIAQLASMAAGMGIPPFEDGTYATVVHPAILPDLLGITEVKAVGEYSDPKLLYTGKAGQLAGGGRFKGEQFMIAGVRFIVHPYGKLYMGAGVPAQAATTLGADAAAGATSITVASASGLAIGDWLTVGTVGSSTAEMVKVTNVVSTTITVQGAGNTLGNFGLKYAHASGAAVTEAPNVAGLPIFGPHSLRGRFASDPGKMGRAAVEFASTVIPRRFVNHSWYWVGGFAIVDKFVLRGEVATTGKVYGPNN